MTPNLELARLVGSYHVHRVADSECEYLQWWDSLTHGQRDQVMWYQRDGVAVFDYVAVHHAVPYELRVASIAEAFGPLAEAFREMGQRIVAAFEDMPELKISVNERLRLYDDLQDIRLFGWQIIPDLVCDWLSAYWPLDWLPWRIRDRLRANPELEQKKKPKAPSKPKPNTDTLTT